MAWLAGVLVAFALVPAPDASADPRLAQAAPGAVQGPPSASGGEADASLRAELRELLKTHPSVRAARNRLEAAGHDEDRAFSGYLPRLLLSGDTGREVIDSPGTRATVGTSREVRKKATLSLTQNLFSGFATVSDRDLSRTQTDIARLDVETVEQGLLLEGLVAYYTVLRQKRLLDLAAQNEDILKEQLQLEDERVQRGSGIAVDVLLAKTRLQLAVERRVALAGQLTEAIARYVQVFNHPPTLARMNQPDLAAPVLPADLDKAIGEALENNPALQATDRRIDAARHTKEAATAGYYPQVDVVGQVNWEDDVDATIGDRRDWSVLLRVSWELFSGFATSARRATAASQQAAAQNTHRASTRRVVEDLSIAWEQLKTARERVRLLENAVVIAEEVFQARQRLRDAGRETAINVLDAQSEVFGARINHVAARFDSEVAMFQVLFSSGLLTPDNIGL